MDYALMPALHGVDLGMGVFIPPGGRVVGYVHHTGGRRNERLPRGEIFTTINKACAEVSTEGYDEYILVLPGHSESLASADAVSNLRAGTKIIGMGEGALRPRLIWSAATSTFLLDVANVTLRNLRLELAGTGSTLTVAAPITISASGCAIDDCLVIHSRAADALATIGITTTAAASHLTMRRNRHTIQGAAGEVTTAIRLVGTDDLLMEDCDFDLHTSSTTVGVVQQLTTASLRGRYKRCLFRNRKAASVQAFTDLANSTGDMVDCHFGILDNATLAGWAAASGIQRFGGKVANLAGESGADATVVSA
jgi:hypothetical protein